MILSVSRSGPYNAAMETLNQIQLLAVLALPVVLAITVHEAAHGWVANRLGDRTALMLGRVTFNPIKHIDPVGTILVPAVSFLLVGFLFGWAKPVPVNQRNLRHPRRDMALVAVAGPAANLAMALAWGLAIYAGLLARQPEPLGGLTAHLHGRRRGIDQRLSDGAQSGAVAAAGRRAGAQCPVAAAACLLFFPNRTLRADRS